MLQRFPSPTDFCILIHRRNSTTTLLPSRCLRPPKPRVLRARSASCVSLAPVRPALAALQSLDFTLELLDHRMALLEILVQAIPLRNQLLLPLPETLLFHLDLLREPLPELLFLLLELGVIQLPRPRLAELACLHLLCAVYLVVRLLGRVDEVEHVCADEDGAKFLEVAVVLVFDLGDAPGVLTALDGAAIGGADVALATDDGEGHRGDQTAGMLEAGLVVLFERRSVDLDALGFDDGANLELVNTKKRTVDGLANSRAA